MDKERRAAAVRRQMDYAGRLKEDALLARQLAVLLGVKLIRGKPLDSGAMRAAIEKAHFAISDQPLTAAGAQPLAEAVALATVSESSAEIEELKANLGAFVLLATQLSSCLEMEKNRFQQERNKCVMLTEQLLEKTELIKRLESEIAKAQLNRDQAFADGFDRGAQQASMPIERLAADHEKLHQKIDALDRCLSIALSAKGLSR